MNEEKSLSRARRLEELLAAKQHSPSQILEMAGLYRFLSATLPDVRSEYLRRWIEAPLLRLHRLLGGPGKGFVPAIEFLFRSLPVSAFRSATVRFCVLLFYAVFFASAVGGYLSRDYAVAVLGEATVDQYVEMHRDPERHFSAAQGFAGTGFYIVNNITLDLLGYATGLLAGIGSIFFTVYNGIFLGTSIGYLLQTDAREGILKWIMGHAAFELTAVGMSAGAGLQTGLAFLRPGHRTRTSAMAEEARAALPALLGAVLLTFVAAFIEGFIAPLNLPAVIKAGIGGICFLFLLAYFLIPSLKEKRD